MNIYFNSFNRTATCAPHTQCKHKKNALISKTRFSLDFGATLSLILCDVRGQKSVVSFNFSRLTEQAGILLYAVLNSCFSNPETFRIQQKKKRAQKETRIKIC
jgi:hypothetical protein